MPVSEMSARKARMPAADLPGRHGAHEAGAGHPVAWMRARGPRCRRAPRSRRSSAGDQRPRGDDRQVVLDVDAVHLGREEGADLALRRGDARPQERGARGTRQGAARDARAARPPARCRRPAIASSRRRPETATAGSRAALRPTRRPTRSRSRARRSSGRRSIHPLASRAQRCGRVISTQSFASAVIAHSPRSSAASSARSTISRSAVSRSGSMPWAARRRASGQGDASSGELADGLVAHREHAAR